MKIEIFAVPLLILIFWSAISFSGTVSHLILPTPTSVMSALAVELGGKTGFWADFFYTVRRTLISFSLAVVTGTPIGLMLGLSNRLRAMFSFLFDFLRSVPPMALFPVFILFFGVGEMSRIAVPYYATVLPMILGSMYGVTNSPPIRRAMARIYGFSDWSIFWKIVVPDAIPNIVSAMRTSLSLSLVLVVVVEMFIGSRNGLGRRISDAHLTFESGRLYALIAVSGVLGLYLNKAVEAAERRLLHWHE